MLALDPSVVDAVWQSFAAYLFYPRTLLTRNIP
jgi:hypothetical protein